MENKKFEKKIIKNHCYYKNFLENYWFVHSIIKVRFGDREIAKEKFHAAWMLMLII